MCTVVYARIKLSGVHDDRQIAKCAVGGHIASIQTTVQVEMGCCFYFVECETIF